MVSSNENWYESTLPKTPYIFGRGVQSRFNTVRKDVIDHRCDWQYYHWRDIQFKIWKLERTGVIPKNRTWKEIRENLWKRGKNSASV